MAGDLTLPIKIGSIEIDKLTDLQAEHVGQSLASIDPWAHYEYPAEKLIDFLKSDDPAAYKYAITYNQQLAGTIVIRSPWLHGPYIQLLGLLTGFQSKGLGRDVLQWVEDSYRDKFRNLWLNASEFNERAIAFYQRFGFEKVGLLDELVKDDYNEILFRKKLRASSD